MSSEKTTKLKKSGGWAGAAKDAKRQIEEAKLKIASLKRTIEICESKIASGEPWPTDATQSPSA